MISICGRLVYRKRSCQARWSGQRSPVLSRDISPISGRINQLSYRKYLQLSNFEFFFSLTFGGSQKGRQVLVSRHMAIKQTQNSISLSLSFSPPKFYLANRYENPGLPSSFTPDQLYEIKKATLAKMVCANSDSYPTTQLWVMKLPDQKWVAAYLGYKSSSRCTVTLSGVQSMAEQPITIYERAHCNA